MTLNPLLNLDVVELRDRLASGAVRAVEYAEACLERIAALEPEIQAWAYLDGDYVLAQARALDARRQSGMPIGPLHGLPVGLKDVIDTARMPTENGTPLDKGRVPTEDAVLVEKLRAAGAIIMGKTVSTEMAFMCPSKTRNPHDTSHTPGGSSAGSAAAVAAAMVPLAVGTQTGGSVIRPASFCGVVGLKPTFGAISRTGVLAQSPSLDTIGVFARSVEGAAMIAEILFGHDARDRATTLQPTPRLQEAAKSTPLVTPTLAFVRPPQFDSVADDDTVMAFRELTSVLGEQCFEAPLPKAFDDAADLRAKINFAEMAKCYYSYEKRGRDQLSPQMTEALDAGNKVTARDYLAALDWRDLYNVALDEVFQRCDVIITPAAPGPAPGSLDTTGNAIFNGLWTLCGTPAITLPLLWAENGLPMGVQLVGRRGDDARLLRTARWLVEFVTNSENEGASS
ncbi:amidase [Thalassospira xianhensis]|uniref:Glutamyl-tRNA amidotransferase n=1 Tax=Thalassospira xianhensis MCCC 1A02616 TaxID=1177929 RepID=A0A367UAA5_9PROT|nr:amidase [Thalassospira xianhensis]RCK04663.1 glutamyl-tRNA amidotransferase [Thalassospira xianhensis MCCC 1A02616]